MSQTNDLELLGCSRSFLRREKRTGIAARGTITDRDAFVLLLTVLGDHHVPHMPQVKGTNLRN